MGGEHEQHPLFLPLVFGGGLIFGFGLAFSHMAQPEIVLNFLQFADFGLLFVMFGAAVITGITFFSIRFFRSAAPLTGSTYGRRLKQLDTNVVVGGGIFGVGWGLSGICPGAAYASLGVGNIFILYGVAGMFIGAYIQGYLRETRATAGTAQPAD